MICPECGKNIEYGSDICEYCGTRIALHRDYRNSFDYTQQIVYSQKSKDKGKSRKRMRLLTVLVSIAVVIVIIVAALWLMRSVNDSYAPEVAPFVTAATTQSSTTAPQTTRKATAAESTEDTEDDDADPYAEQVLSEYLSDSSIYETLASYVDDNMGLSVIADDQSLVAVYTAYVDASMPENQEYVGSLDSYFDEVCSHLDKPIYEMKEATGIMNAEIEIKCVDTNGAVLFDRSVS